MKNTADIKAVIDREFLLFTNSAGKIGISIDNGETVFNPAGRRLPLDENVWEEDDDVNAAAASAAALSAAVAADDFENEAAIARCDADDAAAAERKLREENRIQRERAKRAASDAYWTSPAGRARRAAQNQALSSLVSVLRRPRSLSLGELDAITDTLCR